MNPPQPDEDEVLCLGSVPVALELGNDSSPAGFVPGKPFKFLSMGDVDTLDGRRVRCDDQSAATMLRALSKQTVPVGLTLEHDDAAGRMGECAAGEIRRIDDGLWCLSPLWSPEGAEQIRSGRRTFASATFYSEKATDGTIRPRRLRDISLVAVPNDARVGRISLSAQRTNPSPSPASDRKEQEMNPETLKLLGLADGASQEDVKKAVESLVAAKAAAEKLAATVPDAKELVRQEMAAERESLRAEIRTEMAAERAKVDRAARVASLVERAASEGKVVADNREALSALAAADPDAFEKVLPGLTVLAPVKPWFKPGDAATKETGDDREALHERVLSFQVEQLKAGTPVTYEAAVKVVTAKKVA